MFDLLFLRIFLQFLYKLNIIGLVLEITFTQFQNSLFVQYLDDDFEDYKVVTGVEDYKVVTVIGTFSRAVNQN